MQTNILKLLEDGTEVTINIRANDLKEFGESIIEAAAEQTRSRLKAG